MMRSPAYLDVWKARDGWRWRLRMRRGNRIIAESGEAYTRRRDCMRAILSVNAYFQTALELLETQP